MNLADTALEEFVLLEGTLLASVSTVAKSIDRALIKLGSPSFYVAFHAVTRARHEVARSATAASAYALDANAVAQIASSTADLIQSMTSFLNQVRGLGGIAPAQFVA